jgi:hypothetical protein
MPSVVLNARDVTVWPTGYIIAQPPVNDWPGWRVNPVLPIPVGQPCIPSREPVHVSASFLPLELTSLVSTIASPVATAEPTFLTVMQIVTNSVPDIAVKPSIVAEGDWYVSDESVTDSVWPPPEAVRVEPIAAGPALADDWVTVVWAVAEPEEPETVTVKCMVRALPEFNPSTPRWLNAPSVHFTLPANPITAGVDENKHEVAPWTVTFSVSRPPAAPIDRGEAATEIVGRVAAAAGGTNSPPRRRAKTASFPHGLINKLILSVAPPLGWLAAMAFSLQFVTRDDRLLFLPAATLRPRVPTSSGHQAPLNSDEPFNRKESQVWRQGLLRSEPSIAAMLLCYVPYRITP